MSSTNKWIAWAVAIVIAVIAVLWWSGSFGSKQPAASQSASAAQGTNAPSPASDAAIAQDAVSIDAQIRTVGDGLAALNKNSTSASVAAGATLVNGLISAEVDLVANLQARVAAAQELSNAVALNAQLKTTGEKLLQASAKSGKAISDLNDIKAGQTANNEKIIAGAIAELQAAVADAKSARVDLQAVIDAVKSH